MRMRVVAVQEQTVVGMQPTRRVLFLNIYQNRSEDRKIGEVAFIFPVVVERKVDKEHNRDGYFRDQGLRGSFTWRDLRFRPHQQPLAHC